jgi:hypothetical protein
MKYVPKAERRLARESIEAAKGTDLQSLIELLLETMETERLAASCARARMPPSRK